MAALASLVDLFGKLDPSRWTYTTGRASIVLGRLQLTSGFVDNVDAEQVTTRFGGESWSAASYDMRGSRLVVEVPQLGMGAASAVTEVGVFTSSPRTAGLLWLAAFEPTSTWGWVLRAVKRAGGVSTTVATVRVDAESRRWLRIREVGGTAFWDASPDGIVWTPVASAPAGDVSAVQVALGTWHTSPGDTSSAAQFDSVGYDATAADPTTISGEEGDPYLAVDVRPDNITGVFVVGRSRVGGPDRLAWSSDDPAAWRNVVCNVRSVGLQRGATRQQGVLTKTEAGTVTVELEDYTGQFDPNQTVAVRKGTPVRVRAWGTDSTGTRWDAVLLTGELDLSLAQYVPGEDVPVVTLSVVDLVGPLSAWESEGAGGDGIGAGDTLLQRAQRTLTTVGRGVVSVASSSSYTVTLAPAPMEKPWEELQQATEAELGRLWVDRYNRLQLRARGSQPSGPVRGTLSDVHGQAPLGVHACMEDAQIVAGGDDVANRVLGSRVQLQVDKDADLTPPVVRRDNERSARLHGVSTVDRTGRLMLQTDTQVATWAQAVIVARARPELRVESVTPHPSTDDLDSTLNQWPALLSTDIGDRWAFEYHPPAGPPILRGLAVLGISLDATPDGWSLTWQTEPAAVPGADNPTGWFVVGHSTVGGPDLLAPYAAPYSTT